MANNFDKKGFKLANNYLPPLREGLYNITFTQDVTIGEQKTDNDDSAQKNRFLTEKKFCVAANTEALSDNEIFNISPSPNQQGDFSTELPYIVLNDPSYPWMKDLKTNDGKRPLPWLALIVLSENEIIEENDVKYGSLEQHANEAKKEGIFFPYTKNIYSSCKDNNNIHIIKISKNTFEKIMPSKQDRFWLTHVKKVDLSDVADAMVSKDGLFSVIIANRFPPCKASEIVTEIKPEKPNEETCNEMTDKIKNSIHLVAAYNYDDGIPDNFAYVKMISLYHWTIYSDEKKAEDKSFDSLVEGLSKNSKSVMGSTLKEHYLRQTGEKTYSWYHSPIMPLKINRVGDNGGIRINGEKTFTADGRLIYNRKNGIFDVSYSAAFNLGKFVTLSHSKEAQQIASWRKEQKTNEHIKDLKANFGIDINSEKSELIHVLTKLKEEQLR